MRITLNGTFSSYGALRHSSNDTYGYNFSGNAGPDSTVHYVAWYKPDTGDAWNEGYQETLSDMKAVLTIQVTKQKGASDDGLELLFYKNAPLLGVNYTEEDLYRSLAEYNIYVYPRPDIPMTFSTERTTFLSDAPQCEYSSTEVRDRLERGDDVSLMLDKEVREYIRARGLWSLASKIASLTAAIAASPEKAELYLERGKCYFRRNEWGSAINDFRKAEEIVEDKTEVRQYIEMAEEILEYRYKDIYNP